VLGLVTTKRACAFEKASKRGHRVSVQWYGPMAGCSLAAPDRRDSSEEIHVLPAKVLDLNAAARRRNGEHRREMRDHPFGTARGGLE
jgi:hypothetical protein